MLMPGLSMSMEPTGVCNLIGECQFKQKIMVLGNGIEIVIPSISPFGGG